MSANVEPRGSPDQATFPVATMARVLGVSEAGYYTWLKRPAPAHALADASLLKRVRTTQANCKGAAVAASGQRTANLSLARQVLHSPLPTASSVAT